MYVPQSEPGKVGKFMEYMNKAIKVLKVKWIGLPRAMCTDIWLPSSYRQYARVDICERLVMEGIKVHALGMAAGDVDELVGLFWEGCCSVDSSAPVWRGLHGYRLDNDVDQKEWASRGCAVDFTWQDEATRQRHHEDVKHNMNLVLHVLGQKELP
jgi:hypothetical protein